METVQKVVNPLNLSDTRANIGFWFCVIGSVFVFMSLITQSTVINNGTAGSLVTELINKDILAITLSSSLIIVLGVILFYVFDTRGGKYFNLFLLSMGSFFTSFLALFYAQYSVVLK